MIGLFFLVRDDRNRAGCIGQAVVMIIATAITLCFQLLLNNAFTPLLRFLPQTEVEGAEEEPKHHGTGINSHLGTQMRECSKWLAPTQTLSFIDGAFAGVKPEMENPISNKHDGLGPLAFQHESFCLEKPIVWIL